MNKQIFRRAAPLALALAALLPLAAHAHRGWLLPSATVLSGNEPWVTVDAATSNELFSFEHNALNIDNLHAWHPDGSKATPENIGKGKYRNTFDVKLTQKGTYKIALLNDTLSASYKVDGANKRARGTAESLAKDIPANAQGLNVTRNQSRNELFVTSGKPTDKVLQPTNEGLELVAVTHPNDLFAGDTATFRFLLDGKPLAGLEIEVVPGGSRYRSQVGDFKVVTDADGKFSIKWPNAGMYWLTASHGGSPRGQMGGASAPAAPAGPVGTLAKPLRRASYSTTLEVLPQ